MTEIQFAGCVVRIFPEDEYVETVFPDGSKVPASPHDTDAYLAEAKAHGYGLDTWKMCLHHELLHAMLAEFNNLPYSPVIQAVAQNAKNLYGGSFGDEEGRVMRFQKRLTEVAKIQGWE